MSRALTMQNGPPRLAPLPPDHNPELAPHFEQQRKKIGFAANASLIMQRDPVLAKALWQLTGAVWRSDSKVDVGFKRLIALVSSRVAECPYSVAHQAELALSYGIDEQKVGAAWNYQTNPLYSDAERAALDLAAAASHIPNEVTDEMFAKLRKYWTEEQIVEIVGVIALFGFLNRWNSTMAVPIERKPMEYAERLLGPHGWTPGEHVRDV
jgi:uncharacterized peroxidase-related enzyme